MDEYQRFAAVAVALVVGAVIGAAAGPIAAPGTDGPRVDDPADDTEPGVEQFDSAADFQQYLRQSEDVRYTSGVALAGGLQAAGGAELTAADATVDRAAATPGVGAAGSASGDASVRRAGTNVQEAGISEPSRLKTGPASVYYSPPGRRYVALDGRLAVDRDVVGTPAPEGDTASDRPPGTLVFDSSDPDAPTRVANVSANGRMFLHEDTLLVLQDRRLLGYDVSDPANPSRTWTRSVNGTVVTARLHQDAVYLVTRTDVDRSEPCPVRPLGGDVAVPCTDVYHPTEPVAVQHTYSTLVLGPSTGEVRDVASFVGSPAGTVVYVSANAIYVTYTERQNRMDARMEYLLSDGADVVPSDVRERLREVRSYDLSPAATRVELRQTVERWLAGLSAERRETVQERLSAGWDAYAADHQRKFVRTGVVRVETTADSVSVGAVGEVPGRVNGQFSLDEHEGRLRVTTTVPAAGNASSANDLYVLDATDLSRVGATRGMGLTEQVYSVRYVGDTAYVVTFRRIDPFHVVDLSDPANPAVLGTLKLPGYSSYLHPVTNDTVLGVGEQDGEVKAVLFDVSNRSNPTVADSYRFDAGWSAIAETHHAFLQDPRHGVAVIPTGEGATVLDYTGGDLSVETRVDTAGAAQRTTYVGDSLYVFGDRSLTVVDERDWTVSSTLRFGS